MRQKVLLLALVFILVCPWCALGSDFDWTLTWQADQALVETITTENPELLDPLGYWQAVAEQKNAFTRQTDGWAAYNLLPDRLPVQAITKNYVVIKRTKISPIAPTGAGTFTNLVEAGQGKVVIRAPGFIMKAKPAVKAQWSEGFTATWVTAPGDGQEYNFKMQVVTLEVIPSILFILLIVWSLVWIIYRRQVKRMERLIEERYSLENVVEADIPEIEQNGSSETTAENAKKLQ